MSSQQPRVLVIGATGKTGRLIVEDLKRWSRPVAHLIKKRNPAERPRGLDSLVFKGR